MSQSFLGALALIDVDEEVVPANDASAFIPKRKPPRLKPAIDAVEAPSPDLELEGFTLRDRFRKLFGNAWKVFRMS